MYADALRLVRSNGEYILLMTSIYVVNRVIKPLDERSL